MDDEKIYVSKGEVVLALLEKGQHSKRYKLGESWELNLFEIQEAIDEMPVADVQPVKRGKMILLTDEEKYKFYKLTGNHFDGRCSVCGSCVFDTDNFCAECGADLRKGETE